MKIITLPPQSCPSHLYPEGFTSVTLVTEHRIVWNLLKYLEANGYACIKGHDGEEHHDIDNHDQAIEMYNSVDDSALSFVNSHAPERQSSVWLIGGNGQDVISDYNCADPVFSELMDKFDAEDYL
jgi:hypothetical protein